MNYKVSLESLALGGVTPEPGDSGEAVVEFQMLDSDGTNATITIKSVNGSPVSEGIEQEEPETELTEDELRNQAKAYDEENQ